MQTSYSKFKDFLKHFWEYRPKISSQTRSRLLKERNPEKEFPAQRWHMDYHEQGRSIVEFYTVHRTREDLDEFLGEYESIFSNDAQGVLRAILTPVDKPVFVRLNRAEYVAVMAARRPGLVFKKLSDPTVRKKKK